MKQKPETNVVSPGIELNVSVDKVNVGLFVHHKGFAIEVNKVSQGWTSIFIGNEELGLTARIQMSDNHAESLYRELSYVLTHAGPPIAPAELPASSQFILGQSNILMAGGGK